MLEHIKVVEFATMVAAPAAGGLLADWGADVIKIEPHTGDPMRGGGGPLGTTNYDIHNRGKRSIALNTKIPSTMDIVYRLVAQADVFITNMLPAQLQKLKVDYPDLVKINPTLVYGEVSSFSRQGEHANRPATDNLGFWARGGGTALLTLKDQDPLPIRQSVGDRITGLSACTGILVALLERQMTGKGRLVDASLLRSAAWTFSTDITNQLVKGRCGTSRGRKEQVMPLANYFKTKEGKWLQIHSSPQQLGPALGHPEIAEDPRWIDPRAARENCESLVETFDEIFSGLTYSELQEMLNAAGVRWEPVQTAEDLVGDPQAEAAGCFIEVPDTDDPEMFQRQVAGPPTFYDDMKPVISRPGKPPGIGEQTVEILKEHGFTEEEIQGYSTDGAIPSVAAGG